MSSTGTVMWSTTYYSEQKVFGALHDGKPGKQGLSSRILVQYNLLPVITVPVLLTGLAGKAAA